MLYAEATGSSLTAEQIGFLVQVVAWTGGPSVFLLGLWKVAAHILRAKAAIEKVEAISLIVLGDGNGEYGWKEGRRRLEALGKRINDFNEMATGEHGFYSQFAKMDAKLNGWAQWRHDVIDKDFNRMALQIGRLEDKHEDLEKELRSR